MLNEVAGSLIRMGDAVNPTFFVIALSARLSSRRVEDARGMLGRQCRRHCHIVDCAYAIGTVELGVRFLSASKRRGRLRDAGPPRGGRGRRDHAAPLFDRPFRAGLTELWLAYDQISAGTTTSIGVVGAGGSGKSRMCEEFALEKRRRSCGVVSAKQTKTLEAPHRVLADLLMGLTTDE